MHACDIHAWTYIGSVTVCIHSWGSPASHASVPQENAKQKLHSDKAVWRLSFLCIYMYIYIHILYMAHIYIIHVFVFGDSSPNSCVQEKVKKAFPSLQIEEDTVVFKWQHGTRKRQVSEGLSLWQAAECLSRYSTAVEKLNDEMIGANRPGTYKIKVAGRV